MRALTLLLAAALSGCVLGSNNEPDAGPIPDSGPPGPVNTSLTDAVGTFTVTFDDATQSATVSASFATQTGRPIVLTGMQSVLVGPHSGTLVALATANGANPYTATLTNVATTTQLDFKVDEPTMGVLTSTVNVPAEVGIVSPAPSGSASLSGFTADWTPTDASSSPALTLAATLTLSQTGATSVTETLSNDPGTYMFTASQLNNFGQGTPLTLGVQVSETVEGGIQLLASSSVSVQRSATEMLTPGP